MLFQFTEHLFLLLNIVSLCAEVGSVMIAHLHLLLFSYSQSKLNQIKLPAIQCNQGGRTVGIMCKHCTTETAVECEKIITLSYMWSTCNWLVVLTA